MTDHVFQDAFLDMLRTPVDSDYHGSIAASILCLALFMFGCSDPPIPTGSDRPVTIQRLTDVRLVDIRRDVSWTFDNSIVVIENEGQPIPTDLVEELLADDSTPTRIEATWAIGSAAETLTLSGMKVDGQIVDSETNLRISPAGQIRINLGSRQYNVFPPRGP